MHAMESKFSETDMNIVLKVKVPDGAKPGEELDIVLSNSPLARRNAAADELKSRIIAQERQGINTSIIIWSFLELIIIVLLCLSFFLGNFAALYTTSACNAVNPLTLKKQKMYMSILGGFSSSKKKCATSSVEFCVPWTDEMWATFESQSGASSRNYFVDTAQVMYACACTIGVSIGLVFVSFVFHLLLLFQVFKNGYCLFVSSGYLLLIAWALTLAGQSNLATAPPFIDFFWTQYLRAGGTIEDIVLGTTPDPAITGDDLCSANVVYESGVMLTVSVALLFITMLWCLLASCFSAPAMFNDYSINSSPRDSDEELRRTIVI